MDPWTIIVSWNISETVGLLGLNDTQTDIFLDFKNNETSAVFNAESHMFASSLIPLLLESFVFGIVTTVALLLAYTHLREKSSLKYVISLALSVAVFALHWALAYRAIVLYSPVIGIINTGEFFCEAVLFGALTSLVLFASILFLKPRDSNLCSHWTLSQCVSFVAVVVMYIVAAIHWGLGVRLNLQLALYNPTINAVYVQLIVASSVTLSLSIVCSDAIVLWRACAVWMNRRWIVVLSTFLILATAASSIANVALTVKMSSGSPPGEVVANMDLSSSLMTTPGLISFGMSIFTNIFATLAIAYKTWKHRALVRKHLTTGSRRLITEKIMCIFIESGAVYICLWILYAYSVVAHHVYYDLDNFALSDAIIEVLGPYSYSMIQITAIYPTLIIILVFFERKVHFARDVTTDSDTQTQAQAVTAAAHITIVTMIHSMPGGVFDIELGDIDAEQGRSGESGTPEFLAKVEMPEMEEDRREQHYGADSV